MTRHIGSCRDLSGAIRKYLGRYEGRKIGFLPFAKQNVKVISPFTKPSRGTNASERRTITSGNRAFRFDCERCRLTRGAVDWANKKVAFTLAEVLITLGIIGVVAVLTIPTLISNHRKSVAVQKLKKISSTLLQAQTQADVELGRVRPFFEPQNSDAALEMFNMYYKPYINFTEIKKGDKGVFGYMQDGTAIYFFKNRDCGFPWACTYIAACLTREASNKLDENRIGYVTDNFVNGKDSFGLYTDGKIPNDIFRHFTRSQRINFCKNGNFEACSALIFEAGWQIPKDYPIKF